MAQNKKLFTEFFPISKEEWIAKVKKDLKGKSIETLQWHIDHDIALDPFYHPQDMEDRHIPLPSGKTNDWKIGEDIIVDDPKKANLELLRALQNGVNAPRLVLSGPLDSSQMENLFNEVNLGFISTHFKAKGFALSTAKAFYAMLQKRGQNLALISGSVHEDSLSTEKAAALVNFINEKLPRIKSLCIEIPDESIEKSTQVLANALLKGKNHLSTLLETGLSSTDINRNIYFSISVGNSYFLEIAKIRALHILWLNILAAYGIKNPETPYIEGHLSPNAFEEDANTNIIKSTTQAMSAIVGGIKRLTILPANSLQEKSDATAKRIARNIQHILKMESFFDRVADPAAGSYFVEKLTGKLAENAWKRFQEIEANKKGSGSGE